TVDSPVGGYREEDIKNNFQFPLGFANLEMFARKNDDGSKTGKDVQPGIVDITNQSIIGINPQNAVTVPLKPCIVIAEYNRITTKR
ncbi:hypothetical protein MJM43_31405, partial [Salmonella enterica subsp. enterica serovar Montevideo]|nr:hypothetical protein [Salmonella enterica subsp. enterica serovar Montevideo]